MLSVVFIFGNICTTVSAHPHPKSSRTPGNIYLGSEPSSSPYGSIDFIPDLTTSPEISTKEYALQLMGDRSVLPISDSSDILDNSNFQPQAISLNPESSEIQSNCEEKAKVDVPVPVALSTKKKKSGSCPVPVDHAAEWQRRKESERRRQENLVADPVFDCSRMEKDGARKQRMGRNHKHRFCCTKGPPNRSPKKYYHPRKKVITPPKEAMSTIRTGCIVCKFSFFLFAKVATKCEAIREHVD